jgi:hypothetical protein
MFKLIYRKNIINTNMGKLKKGLEMRGKRAVEIELKIIPSNSSAIPFTRATVKEPLHYSLMGTLFPE